MVSFSRRFQSPFEPCDILIVSLVSISSVRYSTTTMMSSRMPITLQSTTQDGKELFFQLSNMKYNDKTSGTGLPSEPTLSRNMDFYNPIGLKPRLLDMMWKYFNTHWSETNSCSWTFICICTNCRQRPWTIEGAIPAAHAAKPQ